MNPDLAITIASCTQVVLLGLLAAAVIARERRNSSRKDEEPERGTGSPAAPSTSAAKRLTAGEPMHN